MECQTWLAFLRKSANVYWRLHVYASSYLMSSTNVILMRFWRTYANVCLAYGFTRAVTWDYDGKARYYNPKTDRHEDKQMLLVDQTGRVTHRSIAALVVWPGMLYEDLTRLECFVRGKDYAEYKQWST